MAPYPLARVRVPGPRRSCSCSCRRWSSRGAARGALDARKGERLYAAGDFAVAAQVLDRALAADTTPVRAYNAGNAYYRMKRYETAAARYRVAATGPAGLRQESVFNLGNALVRAAEDAPERRQLLLDAVGAYEEALRLDPGDQDAKWNLELALQRLEEDRMAGGSSGRGRAADYGRGNMNVPGYEGNPDGRDRRHGGRRLRRGAGRVGRFSSIRRRRASCSTRYSASSSPAMRPDRPRGFHGRPGLVGRDVRASEGSGDRAVGAARSLDLLARREPFL